MTSVAPTATHTGVQEYGFPEPVGSMPDYRKQNLSAAWEVLRKNDNDILEEVELQQPLAGYHCHPRDVATLVDIRLERDKDRSPERFHLAKKVKQKVEDMLKRRFPAEPRLCPTTKLFLHASVVVASEGSAVGRLIYVGRRTASAKVVIVWCLQDTKTGGIIMGRRVVKTSSLKCGLEDVVDWNAGQHAVMRMAEDIVHAISKEVWEKVQITPT